MENKSFATSLISGAIAGTLVDTILFPLDAIKTRLQSDVGFFKSGGFSRIYSGIGAAFIGSAPTSALFFITYDTLKKLISKQNSSYYFYLMMINSAVSESICCLIRVPVEVVKQRRQASSNLSNKNIIWDLIKREGFLGFYRGLMPTILREIPFALIQYPLWELLKQQPNFTPNDYADYYLKGALAGGIAAAITTPLDVIKTKIILAKAHNQENSFFKVIKKIYTTNGLRGYISGIVPRVLWISLGGAIFLGSYDSVSRKLQQIM